MGQPFNPKYNGSGYDGPLDTDQPGVSLKKVNKLLFEGLRLIGIDIQIGAVEIKNASSDVRAEVTSDNALKTAGTGYQRDDTAVAANNNPLLVAGVTVDPTALPGDTVAGRVKRLFTTLKGILMVNQGALNSTTDSVAIGAATPVSTVVLAASLIGKASAGTLISLHGHNDKASSQFIQVHNSASLPSDGAIPVYSFLVAADTNFNLELPAGGVAFSAGIAVCNSSTLATKTVGSADCWFTAGVI